MPIPLITSSDRIRGEGEYEILETGWEGTSETGGIMVMIFWW